MRLSPFPPDADRPWRGVWILAWHGIREHLRSWWFWASLVLLPVMFLGLGTVGVWREVAKEQARQATGSVEGHVAVVVPDPALRAHVEAVVVGHDELHVLTTAPPADAAYAGVLSLEGADARTVAPRLEVRDLDRRKRSTRWAERVWTAARARALIPPEEHARAGLVEEEEAEDEPPENPFGAEEVTTMAASGAPMIAGGLALFAAMSGFGAGATIGSRRDQGVFQVLRIGTPAGVLFLGSLIEIAVLGALRFVPYLMLVLPVVAVVVLFAGGSGALGWVVGVGAVSVLGSACAFLTTAGVGALLDALGRGAPKPVRALGGMAPLMLMPAMFLLLQLPDGTAFVGAAPYAAVPLLGVPVLAKGIVLGRGLGWGALGLGLSVLLALVAVRAGSWAYAREELRWVDVRLALRGGDR